MRAPDTSAPAGQTRSKQMISTFIVLYPLSLLANLALSTFAGRWPLELRVLLLVVIVSPIMTYFALPLVTRALRRWLMRRPRLARIASPG